MSETCATCRFFSSPVEQLPNGECRRYPKSLYNYGYWPMVNDDDWCGEHQPRDDASPPNAGEDADASTA